MKYLEISILCVKLIVIDNILIDIKKLDAFKLIFKPIPILIDN